ncbi:hypothetical protein FEG63_21425 [Mycolicibacterium sphagni]|uniref:PE domain-containing protein n=1 Tax=Mycolicibacterium sphagni TaxID=1786 RepID=A0ABX2JXG1_9MYCO|nr:hypothetical protein [Mycolicibacterium sphagni]
MSSAEAMTFNPAEVAKAATLTAPLTVAARACGSPYTRDGSPAASRRPLATVATPLVNEVIMFAAVVVRFAAVLKGIDANEPAVLKTVLTVVTPAPTSTDSALV